MYIIYIAHKTYTHTHTHTHTHTRVYVQYLYDVFMTKMLQEKKICFYLLLEGRKGVTLPDG